MNTPKLQLNKTICDTKFNGNFEGWLGIKGTFLPVFFPRRALNLVCKLRVAKQIKPRLV